MTNPSNPLDLLNTVPDGAAQQAAQLQADIDAGRLGFGTQYTEEQRAAQARAVQQFAHRAAAARTEALVNARDTQFHRAVRNSEQMDQNPRTPRYVSRSDPAGGRKKRRRKAVANARRRGPQARAPAPANATAGRFAIAPARRSEEQMAQENMQGVRNWHVENAPDGTFAAYETKKIEWDQYCELVHGSTEMRNAGVQTLAELSPRILSSLYLVNPYSAYNFMFYVAHRKKRSKKRNSNEPAFGAPELAEYREVMQVYGGSQSNPPDPPDCCGFSQVNVYRAALYNVHKEQKKVGGNTFSWEDDINTDALKLLMKKVREREPRVNKRNAVEKYDAHMAPFFYIQWLPHIELYFFSKGVTAQRNSIFSALRNTFTFKFTLAGVLRGESLERADLSDLCDYFWKGKQDPHHIHILIMSICQGKTNKDKKLFGRAMRHRDADMCPLGALALYLWYRLDVDGEWADERPDFLDNHAWFFIKLLVSATTDERIEEMDIKAYADGMQKAMDAVGVYCAHRAHFGRKVMPIQLEMEEVRSDLIKNLGLWAQDVHEQHYSASMPMEAMRVAAGHKIQQGSVFVKREQKPRTPTHERLRSLIFPWLDFEKERVAEFNQRGERLNRKPTAAAFLALLDNLRDVLLQDLAVRMNDPKSPPHQCFRHPIFQSNDFQLYRQEMTEHLAVCQEPELTSLRFDHPGISARFDSLQNSLAVHESKLNTLHTGITEMPTTITNDLVRVLATGANGFAATILNTQAADQFDSPEGNARGIEDGPPHASIGPRILAMPPGTADALCVEGAQMNSSHESAMAIYDQYHGTGIFAGQPIDGGFAKLEESGANWKASYNNAQRQRFSKLKRIVKAIDIRIKDEGETKEAALEFFDAIWSSDEVNRNPSKMIAKLQRDGLLKVNQRKRKAPEDTALMQRRTQHQAASASAPMRAGAGVAMRAGAFQNYGAPSGRLILPPTNGMNPTRIV